MKKFQILLILLVVIGLLISADYFSTQPKFDLSKPNEELSNAAPKVQAKEIYFTQDVLKNHSNLSAFTLTKTTRTRLLFDRFDLNGSQFTIYKNSFITAQGAPSDLTIFELQSEQEEINKSFSDLKTSLARQVEEASQINVTDEYGRASFFYNKPNDPATGFLVVETQNAIFAFQYNKKTAPAFNFIQDFIQASI